MNTIFNRISLAALALVAMFGLASPPQAYAQASWTKTTTGSALDNKSKYIVVTSATGITAPGDQTNVSSLGTPAGNPSFTFIYVDKELMQVLGVNGTTIYVNRGVQGTTPNAHVSGATVWVGPPEYFGNQYGGGNNSGPSGACTSTAQRVLPLIVPITGGVFDCRSSGQWIQIAGGGGESNGAAAPVRGACTGVVGSAETEFLNNAACSGATTATTRQVIDSAGTIASLYVFSSANVVGGSSLDVLTVLKNGSATALTCTIAASAATCNDLTHSVSVAAGDVITFKFVTATSDTAANMSVVVDKY